MQADATDVVFENGNEANNSAEAPNLFDVTPIPYADLVVSLGQRRRHGAAAASRCSVSWTVANQSPNAIGTTNTGEWSDAV